MRSNYKPIGDYVKQVKIKNTDNTLTVDNLRGIRINKEFMPSVANVTGTDLSKYKVVERSQFAYNPMHVGRDEVLPISLLTEEDKIIVSPAYVIFEIEKPDELMPEYFMMWTRREEFDRNAWFTTDNSVRGGFNWEDFCAMQLPVPSLEKQKEIVKEYHTIVDRIKLNEQLNQKLEDTAQEIFDNAFSIQEDMEQVRLGDLIEIKGGFSYHSSDLLKGTAYLLGMGCISFTSRFLEEGMRLYSNDFPEKHQVKPRDIVIATRQQSENMPILGYPAMIPPDLKDETLIVASNLYRVVNNSYLCNEILYQLLRSQNYIEHIKLNTKGTTVGMITKDAVEDFYFNVPPSKVISELEKALKSIANLIFLKREEIKNLIKLKEVLLSKMATIEG